MKKTLDIKKLILLNMPYILLGLFATNFGEAWRMAQGAVLCARTSFSYVLLRLSSSCSVKRSAPISDTPDNGHLLSADNVGIQTVSFDLMLNSGNILVRGIWL